MDVRPQPGSPNWLTRRWLLAIVSGVALATVGRAGTHAISTLVANPDDALGSVLVAAVSGPVAALTLAWQWLPSRLRTVVPVTGLTSLLLLSFCTIALLLAWPAADPAEALRPLWLLSFPVGVLTMAPLRGSVEFLSAAARSGSPARKGREPLRDAVPTPRPAPVGRPAGAVRPTRSARPDRSGRPAADRRASDGPRRETPSAPHPPAPSAPHPPAPPVPRPSAAPAPPSQAPPAHAQPVEKTDTDLRAIATARQVEIVIEETARRVAPLLEKRLVAHYGADWLDTVNTRRRQAGHKPGRRLRDFRFCLAVLGHDPATKGWANDACRRAALDLNRLGFDAVHRSTLTVSDLERAQRVAQRLIENLPRL